MKNYIVLLVLFFSIFSCSDDSSSSEGIIDFSGTYEGVLNCSGELESETGEMFSIVISKSQVEEVFDVDLGDGVIFQATISNNVLVIDTQTHNAGGDSDVITLSGTIKSTGENNYAFDFQHEVDDEGMSNCTTELTKI